LDAIKLQIIAMQQTLTEVMVRGSKLTKIRMGIRKTATQRVSFSIYNPKKTR
jgi:hypothetical protein